MITEINLQLFAASTSSEERTEKATPKKRRDAREKGHVFQSREISMDCPAFGFYINKAHGKNISGIIYEFTVKVLTEYPKMDDLHMPSILASLSADAIIVFFQDCRRFFDYGYCTLLSAFRRLAFCLQLIAEAEI